MTKTLAHRITSYVPWLSVYAVAAGTLYLWGYWSKFHVNILEYIGLLELATAAMLPLLSATLGLAGGLVIGQLLGSKQLPSGGGKDSRIGRFLSRHARLLLVAYLAIVLVGFSLVGTADARAVAVPLGLAPVIMFALSQREFLCDVISDAATRGIVIGILTIVLCSAFGQGRTNAADIVTGRDYLMIDVQSLSSLPGKYVEQTGDFKYLGHGGDYVFALAPDSSLLILRAETVPSIALIHRTTRRPWPPW